MFFFTITNYFKSGNVIVTGLRGRGKDVLFGNVIARIGKSYVSNLDYDIPGVSYTPLDLNYYDCGKNTCSNFISGNLNRYVCPNKYEDIYISDGGVYFPAQDVSFLNKNYGFFPTFFSLSRQVAHCNVHCNVQNLNRLWDKIREQSDIYISCLGCVFIGKIVLMRVIIYDKYQSCVDRVQPFSIKKPILNRDRLLSWELEAQRYRQTYGMVKAGTLVFINKSGHDTYYFEKMLENGV